MFKLRSNLISNERAKKFISWYLANPIQISNTIYSKYIRSDVNSLRQFFNDQHPYYFIQPFLKLLNSKENFTSLLRRHAFVKQNSHFLGISYSWKVITVDQYLAYLKQQAIVPTIKARQIVFNYNRNANNNITESQQTIKKIKSVFFRHHIHNQQEARECGKYYFKLYQQADFCRKAVYLNKMSKKSLPTHACFQGDLPRAKTNLTVLNDYKLLHGGTINT